MGKKLYVGNLPYSVTQQELAELFQPYGTVERAEVITDRYTGRSRGFAFVEMSTEEEAQSAIEAMHGAKVGNREIVVNEARPRRQEPMNDREYRYR